MKSINVIKRLEFVNHINSELRKLKEFRDSEELKRYLEKQGGNRYREGMTHNSRRMALGQYIDILEFNIKEYITLPCRASYKTINKILKHAKHNNMIIKKEMEKYYENN